MPVNVLLRGFAPDIPQDQLVTFSSDLPESTLCIQCNNVCSELYKDPHGHGYCGTCKDQRTTEVGFYCSTCDEHLNVDMLFMDATMRSELGNKMVICPNSSKEEPVEIPFPALKSHLKGCACESGSRVSNPDKEDERIQPQATSQQVHHKSHLLTTKVECPLCSSLEDRKGVVIHMSEKCPKRLVECNFCNDDVEAWEKKAHESTCRRRPGTCEHCLKQFQTITELEDEHHQICPEMPVQCSFHRLGCPFVAARRQLPLHEQTTTHADILVGHIFTLKAENESLRRTIEKQEETHRNTIEKMKDSQNEVELLKVTVSTLQEDITSFQRTITQKDNDIDVLKGTVSVLQQDVQSKNIEHHEVSTSAMQEDMEKFQRTITEKDNDIQRLKASVSFLRKSIEHLQQTITEKDNEFKRLKSSMSSLREQTGAIPDLMDTLSALQDGIKDNYPAHHRVMTMFVQREDIKSLIFQVQETTFQNNCDIAILKRTVSELQEDVESFKKVGQAT